MPASENTGQRPNVSGAITYEQRNILNYFSASNFTQPALGAFGDLGLNTVRLPGLDSIQISLAKKASFHVGSDHLVTAKFEGQFFNIFNHPSFNGGGTTVGSATFGELTSALDPRNIALRVKLSF